MVSIKEKITVIYNLEGLICDLTECKKGDNTEIDSATLRPIVIRNRKRLERNK